MKIGWIDFINTIPFQTAVKNTGKNKIIRQVPSVLNKMIFEGKIDIGIISSAEYIENFEKYLILPDISISSYKNVSSVIIASNTPIDNIESVVLSQDSKTSNMLAKVIFNRFLGKSVLFTYKNTTSKKTAFLYIGDKALHYGKNYRFIYDLSNIWYENTRLPFVFALWCVRREYFYKNSYQVKEFANKLKESVKQFFSQENIDKKIEPYLRNLDFSLKEEHIFSLKKFSHFLKEEKLIKKIPKFEFIER